MLGLIQRVTQATVEIRDTKVAEIGKGLLVLVSFQKNDTAEQIPKLIQKIINYRVFDDRKGRMNLSVGEIEGGILLVPQFTLSADTTSGLRPSFSTAMPPEQAKEFFAQFVVQTETVFPKVAAGEFGSYMSVQLTNDGPVTFMLQV